MHFITLLATLSCLGLTFSDDSPLTKPKYVGYLASGDEETVRNICDLLLASDIDFKCTRLAKTAFFGEFGAGSMPDVGRLKDLVAARGFCGSREGGCSLMVYPASGIAADKEETQTDPHWGLDRLDQPKMPLDRKYKYGRSGKGVTVLIMDTDIYKDHEEFQDRDSSDVSRVTRWQDSLGDQSRSGNSSDCMDHGTQVASLAVGKTYGVAKDAKVVSIKVLDCAGEGSSAELLIGLQWILDNIHLYRPAVVLLSLHVQRNDPGIEDIIRKITKAGILIVTSAGNSGTGACHDSPARMNDTLTVGGTDYWSRVMENSNRGSCVDLYAPGSHLPAASPTSFNAYGYVTGTSFAAALAAGVVAQLLEADPQIKPDKIIEKLKHSAVNNTLTLDGNVEGNYPLLQIPKAQSAPDSQTLVLEPGLTINPKYFQPIDLFKDTEFAEQNVTLKVANYGSADLEWSVAIMGAKTIKPNWVSVFPMNGSVSAGRDQALVATFSSRGQPSGLYQGFIEVSSNDPKLNMVQFPLEVRIFCKRLFTSGQTYKATLSNTVYHHIRPQNWPPPQLPDEEDTVFIESFISFSQPIVTLDEVDIQVPGGLLERFTPVNDELCSTYSIRATKKKENVWNGSNDFCVRIWEYTIFSITGRAFNNETVCDPFDEKPQSRIYATHMSYDPHIGLVTDNDSPTVVVAFSEEVTGFEDKKIEVSPGALSLLRPIPGTLTMFYVQVQLPDGYIGESTMRVNTTGVKDLAGNHVEASPTITFHRVNSVKIHHTSFRIHNEI